MGQRRLAGGLVVAVMVGAALLAVPSAGAASPIWAITASPNTTNYNSPLSISCGSATSCKAVGGAVNVAGVERTLIESWNGTTWTVASSPDIGTNSNSLSGVSCISTTFCQAVGNYISASNVIQTLIESWNGTAWTVTPNTPNNGTSTNVLSGVTCLSTTFCQAVGYYVNAGGVTQTLVESWNGTSWSLATSPNTGTGSNSLAGVSCVSTSACQAVGGSTSGTGVGQTLIESWNGTTWSTASSPNSGSNTNVLQGVACASAGACQAVGYFVNGSGVIQTLVVAWNGSTWAVKSTPNNGTSSNALYDVSCPAATTCEAVGYYVNASNVIQTLVEAWNGTSWAVKSTPNNGTSTNALYGVACLSTKSCLATGSYLNSTNVIQTLVESWNGTAWSISTTPGGILNNALAAVSCESSGFCESVGSFRSGNGAQQTLIESWYGGSWAILPSPNVGTSSNTLAGVSCQSITFCQAVGSFVNGSGLRQTLVESWNGTAWSVTPSPNNGTGANALTGVSCVSTSFCEAVGSSVNSGGTQQTLVLTWNGTTWSITTTPNNGTGNNALGGVSCVSTTVCKAVGSYLNSGKVSRPLVEAWNGSAWSLATTPTSGSLGNFLNGVTCASATSCRAVGYFLTSGGTKQTLVLSFNGTSWVVTKSPNVGSGSNELRGVTCIGTSFCQAVGDAANSKSIQQVLIETWNGTAWAAASTRSTGGGPSSLGGVACLSTTSCKAAGQNNLARVLQTLIESYG